MIVMYGRISTSDKDQNVETQMMPLRDHVAHLHPGEAVREYVDQSPANDFAHRTAWRQLLDDVAKRKIKAIYVWKLDRAFRSVKHMHDCLTVFDAAGVRFYSMRETIDTQTAIGRLLLNLLAALAEFELELIRERVKAGMDRARKQGRRIGRPKVTDRRGFNERFGAILERIQRGELSRRKAAVELNIGFATLKRLLDNLPKPPSGEAS